MRPRGISLALLLGAALSCADGAGDCRATRIGVLSAMPSELEPLVRRARIDESVVIDGRVFRVGELGGVSVVLGQTWIGMANATATARALVQRFRVTGVVVSGVAGSRLRIGDVAVPSEWSEPDGTLHASDARWLALAEAVARPGSLPLEKCTDAPGPGAKQPICLSFDPAVIVGGVGHSGDTFQGQAYGCDPEGGAVYGCDIEPAAALSGPGKAPPVPPGTTSFPPGPLPYVKDMETAAIAREAAERELPFIAFRAASDGAQDPLGLTEPFAQFFVYYRLASNNAAAATAEFLEQLAAHGACPAP
jgi:nucleoside phosphorylase